MGNKASSATRTIGKITGGARAIVGKVVGGAKTVGKDVGSAVSTVANVVSSGITSARRIVSDAERTIMQTAARIPGGGPLLAAAIEKIASLDVPVIGMSAADAVKLVSAQLDAVQAVVQTVGAAGDLISGKRAQNLANLAEVAGQFKHLVRSSPGTPSPEVLQRIQNLVKQSQNQLTSIVNEKIAPLAKSKLAAPLVAAGIAKAASMGVPSFIINAATQSYL